MKDNRTYVGEMEKALNEAYVANHDRNPNRYAQINGWLQYGIEVAIARRSKEPLPDRPIKEKLI